MTKTELWNKVSETLVANKASKKLIAEMEILLAPKSSGGSLHPPKLNDKGEIVEAWCKFHQRYEVIKNMVVSGDKSKGYCKAGISKWNKLNVQVKKYESEAVAFMAEADFENAQKAAQKAKDIKKSYNDPKSYDYDKDWAAFTAK